MSTLMIELRKEKRTGVIPVLSFMILISFRFPNMWVPLGVGIAGFLSGMAKNLHYE